MLLPWLRKYQKAEYLCVCVFVCVLCVCDFYILYFSTYYQYIFYFRSCFNVYSCCLVTESCLTLLQCHGLQPTRYLCPWDFPGKNTRVVAISFSRESSQPRDQICVSCIVGRFFTAEQPGNQSFVFSIYSWAYYFFVLNSWLLSF